ncbi:DMT family transporter [Curtobacterium flaccumfaciens]|uniref:DMT family transporter n=1 Tax=Curtobacterium flaccumfaciens TaxID=2035 RepID=UPI001E3A76BF|nr:EamA family transporter [Curtobacterium allii]MCE0459765.1 EamA family transporter [Curtobacterium allii]
MHRVTLAGFAVVVLWASAFPAIQVVVPRIGVEQLVFLRLFVAAIVLVALAPFLKVRAPQRRDLVLILTCAFCGTAAYQYLLNWGELNVPAGATSLIVGAAPIFSAGIAVVVFREKLTRLRLVGSAVALIGVIVVCLARSGVEYTASVWIVVAAAIAQGIYHPLTKPLLQRYNAHELATYMMVAGAAMSLPVFLFSDHSSLAGQDFAGWGAVAYLGALPSALGFVLWGYATSRLPTTVSTSMLYLVPAVAVLIALIWLNEVPRVLEVIGGAVVLAGVVVITLDNRPRPARAES